MPRISFRRRVRPAIGDMRQNVWVCTMVERPDLDVSSVVLRPGIFKCHARIRDVRPDEILDYQAVFGAQNRPTKEVTIRVPPDVKIDLGHWIYWEGTYANTWLRVRSVEDMANANRFLLIRCSIETVSDQRSDPATQQAPPAWEDPNTGWHEPPLPPAMD